MSFQVYVSFNVHLSEGGSPVSFKYHVFGTSFEATRIELSCAVKINLDWNEMSDYNGEKQFLSNELPIEIGHIAVQTVDILKIWRLN